MQWLPPLTLFLFLYPAGWFLSHLLYLFNRDISSNDLSIIGTIITFLLFLIILPSWGLIRWKTNNIWVSIGLDFRNKFTALKVFFSGFVFSVFLLFILVLFLFLCGWVERVEYIKFTDLLSYTLVLDLTNYMKNLILETLQILFLLN